MKVIASGPGDMLIVQATKEELGKLAGFDWYRARDIGPGFTVPVLEQRAHVEQIARKANIAADAAQELRALADLLDGALPRAKTVMEAPETIEPAPTT